MPSFFASALLPLAGVLAIGSVAWADTISQTITFSPIHTLTAANQFVNPTSVAIAPFDPGLGTLTSVSETLSGFAVLTTPNGSPGTGRDTLEVSGGIMTFFADDPNPPYPLIITNYYSPTPTAPGVYSIFASGDDPLAGLLASVSRPAPVYAFYTTGLLFPLFPDQSGRDESINLPQGITATINYNYTPSAVTPVPEPSGLVMIGTGVVAAWGIGRRGWTARRA